VRAIHSERCVSGITHITDQVPGLFLALTCLSTSSPNQEISRRRIWKGALAWSWDSIAAHTCLSITTPGARPDLDELRWEAGTERPSVATPELSQLLGRSGSAKDPPKRHNPLPKDAMIGTVSHIQAQIRFLERRSRGITSRPPRPIFIRLLGLHHVAE
jgi:hypothetical protein